MFRPLRTAISVVVLGLGLWAAFAVDLGDRTFAEHVDTISETPEAKQLVEDTRETINPALAEVRDRVLGEYVEAPTWIPDREPHAKLAKHAEHAEPVTASRESTPTLFGAEPPLPGRSRSSAPAEDLEPPLPGRR